jgi:DNA-directed RNA polymerase subunit F
MTAAPAEATAEATAAAAEPQGTEPAATETKPAEAQQAKAADWDGKVETLPPAAQKIINDLRKADGDERVAKKTLDAIQKALNPDAKEGEKPDAEALTRSLTEQQAEAKQAKTELAVYKTAAKTGADADALLDSRAFLAKIADLDPTDTKAITKAIEDAVKDNPKLALVRAAGASGSDFSGGSGEGAITQEKFDSMSPSEKNALFKTNPTRYRQLAGR